MIDIDTLSICNSHPFSRRDEYYEGFKEAFYKTYGHKQDSAQKRILESFYFFNKNDAEFNREQFIQYSCELTFGSYFKGKENISIEDEVEVNPDNSSDVDWQIKKDNFTFNIEVKCSVENENDYSGMTNPSQMNLNFVTAGRLDSLQPIKDLQEAFLKNGNVGVQSEKNRDNNMKGFLLEGQKKFPARHDENTISALFIGCGHFANMARWDGYLHASEGLFTKGSFWDKEDYSSVDCVI